MQGLCEKFPHESHGEIGSCYIDFFFLQICGSLDVLRKFLMYTYIAVGKFLKKISCLLIGLDRFERRVIIILTRSIEAILIKPY